MRTTYKPRIEASEINQACRHLDLGLAASRTVGKSVTDAEATRSVILIMAARADVFTVANRNLDWLIKPLF